MPPRPNDPDDPRSPLIDDAWDDDTVLVIVSYCNVCGIKLRTMAEDEMGMCDRCSEE